MGRIEVRQVIEFIEPPNEKVLPYTIMYHGMARLSNEKAKFFSFFRSFFDRSRRPRMYRVRRRGMRDAGTCSVASYVKFLCKRLKPRCSRGRRERRAETSMDRAYALQPPVSRTFVSSCNASMSVAYVTPSRNHPRNVAEL